MSKPQKYILSLSIYMLSAVANAGGTVGNGGDSLALEFHGHLIAAWNLIQKTQTAPLSDLADISLFDALPNLRVATVDDPLETDFGDVKQESTALNFPSNQLILINRALWMRISNVHLKEGLALHEALSLMGRESSGDYRYSGAYVASYGLSDSELNQSYTVIVETAQYVQGSNTYTVTARERYYPDREILNRIRIDYEVRGNGRILASLYSGGGAMMSCTRKEDENPRDLPRGFLQVARTRAGPFGFMIKGLGICGNTTSQRVQLIVPNPDDYTFIQFDPKSNPVIRNYAGQPEIWYTDQEWGTGGTSTSFFVPNRIVVERDGSRYSILPKKMPADVREIPELDFPVVDFQSLYVAGLRTHDWQTMKVATRYFLGTPDFIEWNKTIGLPVSMDEVNSEVQAMKVLAPRLDVFR